LTCGTTPRARVRQPRVRRSAALFALFALFAPSPSFAADTAADAVADKATARTLATEGIDLYNEGRFAEALDRLQRAQQLFDAPIHLLYVARAQTELGQLVEATETYRRLIRVELSSDTPAAVREAVEAADAELDGVDARVPAVNIEVVPAGEPAITLKIDGVPVSTAVVGIDRPLNPGRHRIEAAVPDGRRSEVTLELVEGARRKVLLELGGAAVATSAVTPEAPPAERAGTITGFAGAGVGIWLPFGELAGDVAVRDYEKPGAGIELRAGARFLRYFGAKLFAEAAWPTASSPSDEDFGGLDSGTGENVRVDSSASSQSAGLSLLVGSPARSLGGFGELGFAWQRLSLERDVSFPMACGKAATQSLTLTGPAVRVGGGALIPVSPLFELTAFAHGTIGRFTDAELETDCDELPGPSNLGRKDGEGTEIDGERRGTHVQIVFGLGGNLMFGPR